jgi:folylpolyglutamate synthase/dihydropteroate synthase
VAAFVGEAEIAPSVGDAIASARGSAGPKDVVLVTGSLFTVADAKRALQGSIRSP